MFFVCVCVFGCYFSSLCVCVGTLISCSFNSQFFCILLHIPKYLILRLIVDSIRSRRVRIRIKIKVRIFTHFLFHSYRRIYKKPLDLVRRRLDGWTLLLVSLTIDRRRLSIHTKAGRTGRRREN